GDRSTSISTKRCLLALLYLRHLSRPARTNPKNQSTLPTALLSAMLLQLQLQPALLTSQHCGTRSATQQTNFDLSLLFSLSLFVSLSLSPPIHTRPTP